jgi:predicted permease
VRPAQVQTVRVAVAPGVIDDDAQLASTHRQIAERLAAVPGVTSVGLASHITMDGEDNGNPLYVDGVPVAEGTMPPLRRFKSVAPAFFETMGIRLVAGRAITWSDVHERRLVAVVSETLAREYWKDPARAIGQRVRSSPDNPWREIVGVTGDERDDGLDRPPTAIVYWPLLNDSYQERTMAYAVRSSRVGAPGFVRELQRAVWSVNPNLPVAAVQTLEEIESRSMAQTSFAMVMLGGAAAVALLLGVVGIYGVLAYVAAQRTREIGLRMALGAPAAAVRRQFLRHGLVLTGAGIAVGVVASLALTRVLAALLFGVGPMDPLTYAAMSAALAAVALLATWIPARRASRIDPVVALRAEA